MSRVKASRAAEKLATLYRFFPSLVKLSSGGLQRAERRLHDEGGLILRLCIASVGTYALIKLIFGDADMTGTLTALLVVQASVYRTVGIALERVVAVLIGVGIAIGVSSFMDVGAVSLLLVILPSILVAVALGFGDNKLEVPISGMLILAASSHGLAADSRILNTLIGTGVGLLTVFVLPSPPRLNEAVEAVSDVAETTADHADVIADSVINSELQATTMMKRIYSLSPQIERAKKTVKDVRREHMMNYSGSKSFKRHELDLIDALEAVEECLPQLQKLLVALDSRTFLSTNDSSYDKDLANEIRGVYHHALKDISRSVRAFGNYVDEFSNSREDKLEELLKANERLKGAEGMLSEMVTLPGLNDDFSKASIAMLSALRTVRESLDPKQVTTYQMNMRNRWDLVKARS